MQLSLPSAAQQLSLSEVIAQLAQSSLVDGIAEFGSRTQSQAGPQSDYDLIILLNELPLPVFQMLSAIDERLADIVLVTTETADRLLSSEQHPATLFERLFVRKMQTARILYDRSGRLQRTQDQAAHLAKSMDEESGTPKPAIWFWQSFGLLQLERMAQSQNIVHLLAADMLLSACLPSTWRSYFELKAIPWEGEKAALRYWMQHDQGYFQLVQACLAATNRNERLSAYRALVEQTIQPIAPILKLGETAIALAQPEHDERDIQRILAFWNSLFGV